MEKETGAPGGERLKYTGRPGEVLLRMLNKQRLGTFVLGGIAGALAGILFAPRSGKELRGSIASRAGEARERGRETYFEAQERVQERIAEVRERSPHPREGDAASPLPKLGPDTQEPVPSPEPPVEAPVGTPSDPPPLRDVSRDASGPVSEDTEEIRRRIRETRSRLRMRLAAPKPEDAPGERDE